MEEIGNSSENAKVCVSCHNPSSGAHFCKKCSKPCHAISPCSISINGEEGYGAKVVCCECWLRDEFASDENANMVKTAPSVSDKPTTSASSPSIDYEPNIQLLTSEDEDDSTNLQTKRKRRAFTVRDKIEILDFAKKTSNMAASKHFKIDRNTVRDWKRVVPGGTTKYIQVPDVSWNAPFKNSIRELHSDWMLHGEKPTTSGGNLKAPPMEIYLEWIVSAWESLTKDVIVKSFFCCGITKDDEGKNDALIHVFKKDGAIPHGLPLLRQRRQEEDMIKLVEEIDLNEDDNLGSDFSIEL